MLLNCVQLLIHDICFGHLSSVKTRSKFNQNTKYKATNAHSKYIDKICYHAIPPGLRSALYCQ